MPSCRTILWHSMEHIIAIRRPPSAIVASKTAVTAPRRRRQTAAADDLFNKSNLRGNIEFRRRNVCLSTTHASRLKAKLMHRQTKLQHQHQHPTPDFAKHPTPDADESKPLPIQYQYHPGLLATMARAKMSESPVDPTAWMVENEVSEFLLLHQKEVLYMCMVSGRRFAVAVSAATISS